ncbi:MAG: acetyl-CoA carboxylase biotin carboxyl carrier protein subunit [Rikenellaceae bacterium]|nr:acetyl-CoA carboxylase biotin carboxyl carrier protein subunit [Rikenellaceae bacterium]MDE7355975.1 acetyl-CoA carboxylase biotin carboxyl carrier protein subunit [Rikenellaceae bacterium]
MGNNKTEETPYQVISTMHGDFKTERVTETYRRRKPWEPANPKHVINFIPGTVVSVKVKAGDKVAVGDDLILFKAMKMDSMITSDIAGVVKSVDIHEGDRLPKGTVMIEFE